MIFPASLRNREAQKESDKNLIKGGNRQDQNPEKRRSDSSWNGVPKEQKASVPLERRRLFAFGATTAAAALSLDDDDEDTLIQRLLIELPVS
ncbi:unnamed protein product [Caenorhabditis auriculariae]|uniref:Uncharacterized protein n=1 Tax=Caenorhabditis auriculariae TaxID=2777116 RepID=A0A8S1HXT0_9PELO|nr:unnamed protein product [Caenorhabditis auriculariae]